jgi:hypothetical protein
MDKSVAGIDISGLGADGDDTGLDDKTCKQITVSTGIGMDGDGRHDDGDGICEGPE